MYATSRIRTILATLFGSNNKMPVELGNPLISEQPDDWYNELHDYDPGRGWVITRTHHAVPNHYSPDSPTPRLIACNTRQTTVRVLSDSNTFPTARN